MSLALDLYSRIEIFLDFKDEVVKLHNDFKQIVEDKKQKTLLDVGCGQGDFLLSLDKSIKTLGIDLSTSQVQLSKYKGVNAKVMPIDQIQETFDIITAIFDMINYLDFSQIQDFFNDVYNKLNNNGYFVFDINTKFAFKEVAHGVLTIDKDDKYIVIDAIYGEPILDTKFILFSKKQNNCWEKEQQIVLQYYHKKNVVKNIALKSGFKVEEIIEYNLFDDTKIDKYIFVLKKEEK